MLELLLPEQAAVANTVIGLYANHKWHLEFVGDCKGPTFTPKSHCNWSSIVHNTRRCMHVLCAMCSVHKYMHLFNNPQVSQVWDIVISPAWDNGPGYYHLSITCERYQRIEISFNNWATYTFWTWTATYDCTQALEVISFAVLGCVYFFLGTGGCTARAWSNQLQSSTADWLPVTKREVDRSTSR